MAKRYTLRRWQRGSFFGHPVITGLDRDGQRRTFGFRAAIYERAWIDPDGECIALAEPHPDARVLPFRGAPMRELVRCRFGSHLYGTATETSDEDVRGVFVPDGRALALGNTGRGHRNNVEYGPTGKIVPGTLDYESWSIAYFLKLLCEGNTPALDMIFAPEWAFIGEADAAWYELMREAPSRLVTKNATAFVGYCRAQANKYGIKGSRVATAREALALVSGYSNRQARLGDIAAEIDLFVLHHSEHSSVVPIEQIGGTVIKHWDVCNRKMSYSASMGNAQDVLARIVAEYGERALAAERDQGIDWKALYHAVRVGREAIELLETGRIIFPRPDAGHLLDVKRGQLVYKQVAEEIEGLLETVTALEKTSPLRAKPDIAWAEEFVIARHLEQIGAP